MNASIIACGTLNTNSEDALGVSFAVYFNLGLIGCSSDQDEWQKNRPEVVITTGQVLCHGEPVDQANVFLPRKTIPEADLLSRTKTVGFN